MVDKNTFSVLFYIKRAKLLKNGEAPIFLRITVTGERVDISTNTSVDPQLWNKDKGQIKSYANKASEINNYLTDLRLKIQKHKRELAEKDIPLTAKNLKDAYLGNLEKPKGILEIFTTHNEQCMERIGKDIAEGTVQRYETCQMHLRNYIKSKYKLKEYPAKSINYDFIKGFEHYFKTVRNCGHNSTVKYLRNFHKIVKIALYNDWIIKDPFLNIRYRLEEVDRDYLTEAELHTIINKKISIQRIQRAKDVFLFCCFTGLAFSDVKALTNENIVIGINSKKWVHTRRKKTGRACEIPLLGYAIDIIKKYEDDPFCLSQNQLLPVVSNQKMNAYLKEIADLCLIDKNLTTHTARHTFATTVTLTHQVSIEAVSKMLGHSSINMTKQYARIVDTLVNKEMEKVQNLYSVEGIEKSEKEEKRILRKAN